MGHPDLIQALVRVKNSFNSYPLDRLAILGAVAAIKDKAYFDKTRAKIIESREYLMAALKNNHFKVLPSSTNFVFASHPDVKAQTLYQSLKEQGILVRHFNQDRISDFIRITIGTRKECEQFIASVKSLLGNNSLI